MFALIAAVCFFLHALTVKLGDVSLVWLGIGFLALHLAWTVALPTFTGVRRSTQ